MSRLGARHAFKATLGDRFSLTRWESSKLGKGQSVPCMTAEALCNTGIDKDQGRCDGERCFQSGQRLCPDITRAQGDA